jgi:hypothetical protein
VGPPTSTKTIDTLAFAIPYAIGHPAFSAEVLGTLSYPAGQTPCFENDQGCYVFDCDFKGATFVFLWIDDHLVCQKGAYIPKPNTFDGSDGAPLRALSRKEVTVRLQLFYNPETKAKLEKAALLAAPAVNNCSAAFAPNVGCDGNDIPGGKALKTSNKDQCCAACLANPHCSVVTWNGPDGPFHDGGCNLKYSGTCKKARQGQYFARLRPDQPKPPPPSPAPTPAATAATVSVKWGVGNKKGTAPSSFAPLPSSILSPTISDAEAKRISAQTRVTTGWGCWANSVLDIVLLPEGARLTVGLCEISTGKCILSTRPSDTATMRVAEHAYDKSFVRMFLTFQRVNVSISFSAGGGGGGGGGGGDSVAAEDPQLALNLALEPQSSPGQPACGGNCSDYAVVLMGDFAWERAGAVAVEPGAMTFTGAGLRKVRPSLCCRSPHHTYFLPSRSPAPLSPLTPHSPLPSSTLLPPYCPPPSVPSLHAR